MNPQYLGIVCTFPADAAPPFPEWPNPPPYWRNDHGASPPPEPSGSACGWRDRIEDPLFAVEDMVLIGLDERENRVFVDLADGSGRAEAETKLRAFGVPPEAVYIAVVGEATPLTTTANTAASATSGCDHLQQYCRPLVGGYQITFARDGGSPTVTPARSASPPSRTASHDSSPPRTARMTNGTWTIRAIISLIIARMSTTE